MKWVTRHDLRKNPAYKYEFSIAQKHQQFHNKDILLFYTVSIVPEMPFSAPLYSSCTILVSQQR